MGALRMDRLLPCICRDRAGSFNLVLKTREFGYDVMLVARGQGTIYCWAAASVAPGEGRPPQQAIGGGGRGVDGTVFSCMALHINPLSGLHPPEEGKESLVREGCPFQK
jgi:hypothetical protein